MNSIVKPAPDTGVHYNMAEEDYHDLGGWSKSTLWWGVEDARSGMPLRLRLDRLGYFLEHGFPALDSYRMGSALDNLVFDPQSFDERFLLAKSCSAELASGKNKGRLCGNTGIGIVEDEWRCGQHGGDRETIPPEATVLAHEEMSRVRAMAHSLWREPLVCRLHEHSNHQVSMIGTCPHTGLTIRGRLDWLDQDGVIWDLKTTSSRSPVSFVYDSIRYGYHVQAAIYHMLCRQHGVDASDDVRFVTVSKDTLYGQGDHAVHDVWLVHPGDDFLALGYQHYEQLVRAVAGCIEFGEWPAPNPTVTEPVPIRTIEGSET